MFDLLTYLQKDSQIEECLSDIAEGVSKYLCKDEKTFTVGTVIHILLLVCFIHKT